MGCWVGGAQVHGFAALDQAQRQCCGDGGLAHATLAHHHNQPMPGLGQYVGQLGQACAVRRAGQWLLRSVCKRGQPTRKQGAQRGQTHRVKGPQGHAVLRQRTQFGGQCIQRLRAQCLDGAGNGIGTFAGVEYPVDHQPLVVQAQAIELFRGARCLGNRTRIRPGHQHYRGLGGVA